MNTIRLLELIVVALEEELLRAEKARSQAQDDANAHIGAMQSRYDTFKEEAQYLAAGQGRRRQELEGVLLRSKRLLEQRRQIAHPRVSKTVVPGAAVQLSDDNDQKRWVVFVPGAGGRTVEHDGIQYAVVSTNSPLGRSLMGKTIGDFGGFEVRGEEIEYEVIIVVG